MTISSSDTPGQSMRVNRLALDQARADASSRVTHLTYTAVKR
jgi:hypothetical protein